MKIVDYCDNIDCPVHPNNPDSKSSEKLILQSENGDIQIEVSFPCLICNRAEKVDMKEMLKRAVLKNKLKGDKNRTILGY